MSIGFARKIGLQHLTFYELLTDKMAQLFSLDLTLLATTNQQQHTNSSTIYYYLPVHSLVELRTIDSVLNAAQILWKTSTHNICYYLSVHSLVELRYLGLLLNAAQIIWNAEQHLLLCLFSFTIWFTNALILRVLVFIPRT